MGFVLFCFFSVFSFNLTIYGCPSADPNPHLYLVWLLNDSHSPLGLAQNMRSLMVFNTQQSQLVRCQRFGIINYVCHCCCLCVSISFSIPYPDSISFCSVSISFCSLLSCCLSSPLQAGKTGLLKKETRSWRHSLNNRERERERDRQKEDREAFIVTGPQTPTLSNTISGSGNGDSQVSVLVLEPQFVFAQRLLFVCRANWKSAQPLAPYIVFTCHQFTHRPALRHSATLCVLSTIILSCRCHCHCRCCCCCLCGIYRTHTHILSMRCAYFYSPFIGFRLAPPSPPLYAVCDE